MFKWSKTQRITLAGMFAAIIFLLTFTPLGFPQIPLIGSATIVHIPVIIGAILLGPKMGAVLGFMFGLSSMIFATTQSLALNAFAFTPFRPVPGTDNGSPWALLIAFVPRILVGVISPLVFYGLMKVLPKRLEGVSLAVAAAIGSMVNTLLVMNFMFLIFREPWSYARENAAAGQREAANVYWDAAVAAWESAYAAARDAAYALADMTSGLWGVAADYARYAVEYEQAALAADGRVIVAPQITYAFVASIIAGFGVPEAIAAAVIVPAVCIALFAVAKRTGTQRA